MCTSVNFQSCISIYPNNLIVFPPNANFIILNVDWGHLSMLTLCFRSNTVASSSPTTAHRQPLMLTVWSPSLSSSSCSPPWPYYLISIR